MVQTEFFHKVFLIKSDDETFDISGDDDNEEKPCLNRGHNRGAGGLLL